MRAWQTDRAGEPGAVLSLVERSLPAPGPGEVRLRVLAAGLGLPDVLMCRGTYLFKPPYPFVPGQEIAGVVDAVGEGATLKVGVRVMGVTSFYAGHGGFAEFCLAPEFSLYPVPETMDETQAAGFTIPFHTAWVGLHERARLAPGETVLVHGAAGGSGDAAVRVAKAHGARVIAVAGGREKGDFCRAAGADEVIDHHSEDFVECTLALTGGSGADVVFDPVGADILERSVHCTAARGRLLAVGFAAGQWGRPDTGVLVVRNCAVLGVYVGAYGHDEMLGMHAQLTELLTGGELQPAATSVAQFSALPQLLGQLADRRLLGKAVVRL